MDLAGLRKKLALTQSGLGRIVGAHAMTVSKWERGVLRPSGFQRSILSVLDAAAAGRRVSGPAHELAGYLNDALIDVTEIDGMKLSASNQFKGRISKIEEGPVTTRVVIQIAPKVSITSLITTASVRRLGLETGKTAVAIIKATEVIIGTT